jgi:hypothetical protein
MNPRATETAPELIELMVRNVDALFHSMDPSPFREKDLNAEAEAFIVGWARQYAPGTPLRLRVHLQEAPAQDATAMVTDAIHNYFDYRRTLNDMDFRRLLREGRLSLAIGLGFMMTCLLIQHYVVGVGHGPFRDVLRESLTIAGWVGMWQPIQIYLYSWWPLRRQRRILTELSQVPVELVSPPAR